MTTELYSPANSECVMETIGTTSPVREAAVTSSGADLLRGIDQKNSCTTTHLAIFHGRNANSGRSLPHQASGLQEPSS